MDRRWRQAPKLHVRCVCELGVGGKPRVLRRSVHFIHVMGFYLEFRLDE